MHVHMLRRRVSASIAITAVAALGLAVTTAAPAHAAAVLNVAIDQPLNPIAPSTVFTSAITVTNTGDVASLPSAITIYLPRASTANAAIGRVLTILNAVPCITYTSRFSGPRRVCTVPAIAAGATFSLATYKVTGPATVPFVGTSTSVSVGGPSNSVSATYTFAQAGMPDLSGGLGFSTSPVFIGAPGTMNGSVSNLAYGAAGSFGWHIDMPGGSTNIVITATNAATTCSVNGVGIDCTTTTLANGASFPFAISYNAPTVPGSYAATLTIDATNAVIESNESNNIIGAANALTVPGSAVNFSSIIVSQPTQVIRGTVFTRSVTITNNGGSDALNVTFTDRFNQFPWVGAANGSNCGKYVTYGGRPSTAHYNGVTCIFLTPIAAGTSVTMSYNLSVPLTLATAPVGDTVTLSTTSFQQPGSIATASGSTSVLGGTVAPTSLTVPGVTGNAVVGQILATTAGTWIGTATITTAVQWQRCDASGANCADITGATGLSYTPIAADAGSTLRSFVTATNPGGSTTAASAPTTVVIGAIAPSLVTAPALLPGLEIQPTFQWGVTTGTWSGTPTITFAVQWMRCNIGGGGCIDIPGATNAAYVLQDADVFHSVQVRVTATNNAGSTVAYSDVSAEVDPFG